MDLNDVSEYLKASKDVLDILKTLGGLLPTGPNADAAQQRLEQAENALRASEAQLAKALGYQLCQCTFPPQIMLWREDRDAHVCPRSECGHGVTSTMVRRSEQGGSWNRARRGR